MRARVRLARAVAFRSRRRRHHRPRPRPRPPAAPAAKRTVRADRSRARERLLHNARVNNSDVRSSPTRFRRRARSGHHSPDAPRPARDDPDVLRGSFSGEVDVDFTGGQQPSSGGRTFPLLRLRRAVGIVSWPHAQLLFGRSRRSVAERSRASLASVGPPDFATAGNLWLCCRSFARPWSRIHPAPRGAGAVLARRPELRRGSSTPSPTRRSGAVAPTCKARVRLAWGPSTIRARSRSAATWDGSPRPTRCSNARRHGDARVKAGPSSCWRRRSAERRWRDWAAVDRPEPGADRQGGPHQGRLGSDQRPARREVMVGGGCGIDDPDDRDLSDALGSPRGRLKNSCARGTWISAPAGPLCSGSSSGGSRPRRERQFTASSSGRGYRSGLVA